MPYLAAAVVFVGLLGLLNLALTLGVVKRLRAYTQLLSSSQGAPSRVPTLPVGEKIDDFRAVTTDGVAVSRDQLTHRTLVAFLAEDCTPCRQKLPSFVEYARHVPGGRNQILAVVVAERKEEAAATVAALSPVARVVVEHSDGPVGVAFGVVGFPAFCLVDEEHRIVASRIEVSGLPVATTV